MCTHTHMHTYNLFTFHVNVKQPINFVILMKRNWNSPREVPTRIAVGVASPSAHGQETTWANTNSPAAQKNATLFFFRGNRSTKSSPYLALQCDVG